MSELANNKTNKVKEDKNKALYTKETNYTKTENSEEIESQTTDIELEYAPILPKSNNIPSKDLLDGLKSLANVNVAEKIEIVRLQLENERIEIEKTRDGKNQKFWVRNFGTTLTAIISLTAVLVSFSQVWIAKIQKDKEIEIANTQKTKELETTILLQDRAWKFEMV